MGEGRKHPVEPDSGFPGLPCASPDTGGGGPPPTAHSTIPGRTAATEQKVHSCAGANTRTCPGDQDGQESGDPPGQTHRGRRLPTGLPGPGPGPRWPRQRARAGPRLRGGEGGGEGRSPHPPAARQKALQGDGGRASSSLRLGLERTRGPWGPHLEWPPRRAKTFGMQVAPVLVPLRVHTTGNIPDEQCRRLEGSLVNDANL